jgi:soluble lytic murein transglycosylase
MGDSLMDFRRVHLVLGILLTFTVVVLYTQTNIIGSWIYPIKYKTTIQTNAEVFHIDPYLIAAIIRVESNFDPDKVSARQATGLMQLMPATAEYTIDRLSLQGVSSSEMDVPQKNIHVGTAYLNVLKQTFVDKLRQLDGKSQIALIAVAYNAGPGSTSEWLRDQTWSGDVDSLSDIPFGETRHYVQRILYYYNKYKELDGFQTKYTAPMIRHLSECIDAV